MTTLYIVGTPIGNLEDITMRALRILGAVPLIAAEDTRKARVLLDHYNIKTSLTSFFEGNKQRKLNAILEALSGGDVALISDAGMPGISDPGYTLIRAALEEGFQVVPIPGPSAHTAALVASGLPTDSFLFLGFLSRKANERKKTLYEIHTLKATLVLYEAPHRLEATLNALLEVLGNRSIALCREMTKLYEEVWRGDIQTAIENMETRSPRGEYTLVVAGAPEEAAQWDVEQVKIALGQYLAQGYSPSQAARAVAKESGWSRREIYKLQMEQ
ncbi:MAG: 16S rRNA (cytidine(1402)-2'-O)-methyltransferase [Anaerolineae bacterium]|nr:16S rRNA (cytidine(1402)-2'-O)-methyltransferase [Anaerolineae bacterium]